MNNKQESMSVKKDKNVSKNVIFPISKFVKFF